jgi:type I restriction-modification system DNA methylase subunit
MFADTEGKRGGQFYTPRSIVRVLVEMIEPYHGGRGEVLFIDARNMGVLRDRTHRELTDDEVQKIADTYHAWRGERVESGKYEDVPGFCKAATLDEIKKHDYISHPMPL